MNVLYKLYYTLIFGAVLSPQFAHSQTAKKYSVFKDGKAFIYAQDTVKAQNGKSLLAIPQEALFGTLWFNSSSSPMVSVKTVNGGFGEKRNFNGLREMLSHNIGKKVRLILAYQEPLEATVSSVMNDYVVFKTKDRWISTNIDEIETIEFLEEPLVQTQDAGRQLEIEWTNKSNANHFLSTAYMCKGIGWIPEYRITLSETDETTAEISLSAKLVNDVEDLKNAEVNFVAGAPEFSFGNVTDPVASSASFEQIIEKLNEGDNIPLDGNQLNYLFNTTSAQSQSYGSQKPSPAGNIITPVNGEGAEDLYYYTLKNLNLAKGSRASFPLFEAKIPVRHIYTVELDNNNVYFGPKQPQNKAENTVYHKLELSNTTVYPFTSGSAFLVKESGGNTRPLSQNILPFAPKGGKTQLQMAAAPDVVVTDKEKEILREANQASAQDKDLQVVNVEGEVTLKNYKDKELIIEVRRTITGELMKSDIGWKVSKDTDYSTSANAVNNVLWEVTLKPGETKTIRYKYKVLAWK
ncbi:MAG: DUF4139 domain-containing protein [Bacteroidia bacterium]